MTHEDDFGHEGYPIEPGYIEDIPTLDEGTLRHVDDLAVLLVLKENKDYLAQATDLTTLMNDPQKSKEEREHAADQLLEMQKTVAERTRLILLLRSSITGIFTDKKA